MRQSNPPLLASVYTAGGDWPVLGYPGLSSPARKHEETAVNLGTG